MGRGTLMIAVVCVDDGNGMMFNGRRQSRDRIVTECIVSLAAGKPLWMNGYTAGLFEGMDVQKQVREDFLLAAGTGEVCVVEDRGLSPVLERLERLIIFRWNRKYPADFYLDVDLKGWKLIKAEEFPGNSHEKITQEIYVKK